jgi:medium-chain acyl-[acyl-carrier-protein] hydrolase
MASEMFACFKRVPDAAARLFCFPHAGGAASAFRPWAMTLPCEVHAAQPPGRWNRLKERAHTRMEAMVEEAFASLLPLYDRPAVLFGHSLGALVAFEVAHRLLKVGREPPHALIVSGRRAPHLPMDTAPVTGLQDPAFIDAVGERYGGIPSAILADNEMLALILPALRADMELFESYAHVGRAPLTCPIHAWAGDADRLVPDAGLDAWREHTTGMFEASRFAGGHFYLQGSREVLARLEGVVR